MNEQEMSEDEADTGAEGDAGETLSQFALLERQFHEVRSYV